MCLVGCFWDVRLPVVVLDTLLMAMRQSGDVSFFGDASIWSFSE